MHNICGKHVLKYSNQTTKKSYARSTLLKRNVLCEHDTDPLSIENPAKMAARLLQRQFDLTKHLKLIANCCQSPLKKVNKQRNENSNQALVDRKESHFSKRLSRHIQVELCRIHPMKYIPYKKKKDANVYILKYIFFDVFDHVATGITCRSRSFGHRVM